MIVQGPVHHPGWAADCAPLPAGRWHQLRLRPLPGGSGSPATQRPPPPPFLPPPYRIGLRKQYIHRRIYFEEFQTKKFKYIKKQYI